MVDNVAKGSNVTSEMFDVQDSSFLAGAVSAMLNQTKTAGINGKHTIGAIGGVKSPGIDQFLVGYQQGAQYIDKSEKMLLAYANSFADPSKGAALTNSMFSQGATVVYQVAAYRPGRHQGGQGEEAVGGRGGLEPGRDRPRSRC